MQTTGVKTNARRFQKLWAFLSVTLFAIFLIAAGSTAQAAVTNGITAKIYTGYNGSTTVRPMDNAALANNYTLCKTTTLSQINTNYGSNVIEGCAADYVLIHYTGYIYSPTATSYTFQGYSDDGFWAKVGTQVVVNNWSLQGCAASSTGTSVSFTAGEYKPIDAWFFEHGGGACSMLYYTPSGGSSQAVPASMFTTTNYAEVALTDTTIDTLSLIHI